MIHVGNKQHGKMIMKSIQSEFTPVTMKVISREEQEELYGGVIYENWTGAGGSVIAHVAGFKPNWMNRDMLYIIFDYPFKQLEVNQVFTQIASKNEKSIKFCEALGFKRIITLEGVYPDDDVILFNLKKADCRFLNVKPKTVMSRRVSTDG